MCSEVACFRCEHVFEVTGPVEDMWVCADCQQDDAERADDHAREVWHGSSAPQNERERRDVEWRQL